MKKAYIVASNSKYLPGLNALLNSLDYVKNTHDVIILSYKLPRSYMDAIENANFSYTPIFQEIPQSEVDWLGEGEVLMRKRYLIPSVAPCDSLNYDAVCILDADMFFAHNVDRYLDIAASTDLVMGCGLEQKRRYGDLNDQYPAKSGKYIIDPEFWNGRDLCCAPLFVGKRWYPALKKSWEMVNNHPYGEGRFLAPEMNAINICLLEAGSYERTIPLSQHNWTGLHECMMKAHTRAIEMHDELFTEDGEEINCVHGQWWLMLWRKWQIDGQLGMISREYNNSASYISRSTGSFELLIKWFKKMCEGWKVDIRPFVATMPECRYESQEPA